MQVQSTTESRPPDDLGALFDAPPQDEASREARLGEFEASLADALIASIDPENAANAENAENAEKVVDQRIDPPYIDEVDIQNFASQRSDQTVGQSLLGQITLALRGSSSPAASNDLGATPQTSNPAAGAVGHSPNSSQHVQHDFVGEPPTLAPSPEHAPDARTADQLAVPESRRAAGTDQAVPPASPVALGRAEGLDTAASARRAADQASVSPINPEAAGKTEVEARRRGAVRVLDPPHRAGASDSHPESRADRREFGSDIRARAQSHSSRSDHESERLPYPDRLAAEIRASTDQPNANTSRPSVPSTVAAMAAIDLAANGIQKAPLNLESTSQLAPRQPVEALSRNAELLATRGGGTARMRLHPAQLGEIDITISLRGDVVDVIIHAEEPAARAAVMAHREQLAEALGSRDLRMDGFDVNDGNRDNAAEGRQAAWSGAEDRRGPQQNVRDGRTGTAGRIETIRPTTQTVSGHPNHGIDVRI